MTIRFFILMSHYRSTLDFSNEALKAAEKGLERLSNAMALLDKLKDSGESTFNVAEWKEKCLDAMNDDFNTPILIAQLFEGGKLANQINEGKAGLNQEELQEFVEFMNAMFYNVLGLKIESAQQGELVDDLMNVIIELRKDAKDNKNYELSDKIRDELGKLSIEIRDSKEGSSWTVK